MAMTARWVAVLCSLISGAPGCIEDDRWTEIIVTADPELVAPDTQLGYCIWDDASPDTAMYGSAPLLRVVDACTPADDRSLPLPGTIVVRNTTHADRTVQAFFQLSTSHPSADAIEEPCRLCPPAVGTVPTTGGVAPMCITSRWGSRGTERLDLRGATVPAVYTVRVTAGGVTTEGVDGADAGRSLLPDAGCER